MPKLLKKIFNRKYNKSVTNLYINKNIFNSKIIVIVTWSLSAKKLGNLLYQTKYLLFLRKWSIIICYINLKEFLKYFSFSYQWNDSFLKHLEIVNFVNWISIVYAIFFWYLFLSRFKSRLYIIDRLPWLPSLVLCLEGFLHKSFST